MHFNEVGDVVALLFTLTTSRPYIFL